MGLERNKRNKFFSTTLLLIIGFLLLGIFISAGLAEIPPIPPPPPIPSMIFSLTTWASPDVAPLDSTVNFYASFTDENNNYVASDCVLSINNNDYNMNFDENSELYFYSLNDLPLGQHFFVVTCSGISNSSNVTIVQSDDEAPVIQDLNELSVSEGSLLEFSITASDNDGPELMFSYDSLPDGMIVVSHESSGGGSEPYQDTYSFSWTPDYNQAGTYTINFQASDTIRTDSQAVTINVVDADNPYIPDLPEIPGTPSTSPNNNGNNNGGSGGSGGGSGGGSSGGRGGGGGSGGYYVSNTNVNNNPSCEEHWVCTPWSRCESGYKKRDCTDVNNCGSENNRPPVTDACSTDPEHCHNNIMDEDEEGIDCGGAVCNPCSGRVIEKSLLSVFGKNSFSIKPGEHLIVPVINTGDKTWSNLKLIVDETKVDIPEILPGEKVEVEVALPVERMLAFNDFEAKLFDSNNNLVYSDVLSVDVEFPEEPLLMVDTSSGKPLMYLFYDNTGNDEKILGLEGKVVFLKDGEPFFEDIVGPYKVDPGEKFVRVVDLPTTYLTKGNYDVKTTFFKQGKPVASSDYSFSLTSGSGFPWRLVLLLLITALLVFIVFELINAFYNKKSFSEIINEVFGSKKEE